MIIDSHVLRPQDLVRVLLRDRERTAWRRPILHNAIERERIRGSIILPESIPNTDPEGLLSRTSTIIALNSDVAFKRNWIKPVANTLVCPNTEWNIGGQHFRLSTNHRQDRKALIMKLDFGLHYFAHTRGKRSPIATTTHRTTRSIRSSLVRPRVHLATRRKLRRHERGKHDSSFVRRESKRERGDEKRGKLKLLVPLERPPTYTTQKCEDGTQVPKWNRKNSPKAFHTRSNGTWNTGSKGNSSL